MYGYIYLGILQGISILLLTFDESEVRRIVTICQHVLNHLSYAEIIETTEQLVDFVKVNTVTNGCFRMNGPLSIFTISREHFDQY